MIKSKVPWSAEEEWILFLLNRDEANKWADIANILEGRTDNTIKNHWNSSMKRHIKDYHDEFARLLRLKASANNVPYQGCEPVGSDKAEKYSKPFVKVIKQLEQELVDEKSSVLRH